MVRDIVRLREAVVTTILEIDRVTVGATAQTLEELGVTLDANVKIVTLWTDHTYTVYWDKDDVPTVNSPWLPQNGMEMRVSVDMLDDLRFVSPSGNVEMCVAQEG